MDMVEWQYILPTFAVTAETRRLVSFTLVASQPASRSVLLAMPALLSM